MKKRVLTLLFALSLLAGVFAVAAVAADANTVAVIGSQSYTSLQDAINAYTDTTTCIQLLKTETAGVKLDTEKEVYLDLNGCDITGAVTVTAGTLYCMDSQTDDYAIDLENHTGYGKLTGTVSGAVTGVPVEAQCAEDGYLMVEEEGYGVSFHRVNLQIYAMTLRAKDVGVYYKSNFAGDELVAANVKEFGVALSIQEEPTAENLSESCQKSWFTGFKSGNGANANDSTSTLLKGVMKTSNATLINKRNASLPVYGKAYILTENGYMLGGGYQRSLKEQVEAASAANWSDYDDTQVAGLISMCKTYGSIMCKWDIPEITSKIIVDKENPVAKEGETLKVLAITSSFGLNTTQLLYDVAVAEGYNPEDVIVARLYTSGCTLEKHLAHAPSDEYPEGKPVYQYTKITSETGQWVTVKAEGEATLLDGLQDEDWDIIFMQQGAAQAPQLSSYTDANGQDRIDLFRAIVNQYAPADAKFVWNMLWGYQSDSTIAPFPTIFRGDQMYMYQCNVNTVSTKVVPRTDFDAIIPSGTVIQNARTSAFGDTLCRDTYHLNNYGGIMAAYGLYATLTGQELTEINIDAITASANNGIGGADKITVALTETQKAIIMESVNNALADPFQVTESEYK